MTLSSVTTADMAVSICGRQRGRQSSDDVAIRPGLPTTTVVIYVTQYCPTCVYSHEVAAFIRANFPHVVVRLVDLEEPGEEIPESVFATPTYLLDGRLWSLGNPSLACVMATLRSIPG